MLKIKNIEQLQKLKEKNWNNPYTQRQFKINTIREFKYLLENYKQNFAFSVNYNSYEYSCYINDDLYIRNNDTYKFEYESETPITSDYHLKSQNINDIINFIVNEKEDISRRFCLKFINIEANDNIIEGLLNNNLVKVFQEDSYEWLMYSTKNENKIKKIIGKHEYCTYNIDEILSVLFQGTDMIVENIWDDTISLYYGEIVDLIKDDLYTYIPGKKQKEIYESKNPKKQLEDIFNKIGREQLRIQIENLLLQVDKTDFK